MKGARSVMVVGGIHTPIPLHLKILSDENFVAGNFDTNYIGKMLKQ